MIVICCYRLNISSIHFPYKHVYRSMSSSLVIICNSCGYFLPPFFLLSSFCCHFVVICFVVSSFVVQPSHRKDMVYRWTRECLPPEHSDQTHELAHGQSSQPVQTYRQPNPDHPWSGGWMLNLWPWKENLGSETWKTQQLTHLLKYGSNSFRYCVNFTTINTCTVSIISGLFLDTHIH